MAATTIGPRDTIRQLMESTEFTRDALPYTDEFERLHADYLAAAGVAITRHELWRLLSNTAKRGGWKGKQRGEPAPELTPQQSDTLRSLIAGQLGSRDRLAYTSELTDIQQRFNTATGLSLTERETWRAIGNIGKKSHRPDVDVMLAQSIDSLILGIEHFNRPSDRGRQASVLIMLDHAGEILLKAALLQRGSDIHNPKTGYAHSFDFCLNKATDEAPIKFLSDDERRTLRTLNSLRDQAQHYLVDVSEQMLYMVAQSTVTLFAALLSRVFGQLLCDHLPDRVLPISVNPPRDIHVLMDEEFSQLKAMLAQVNPNDFIAQPRLRSLITMDRALRSEEVHIPDAELEAVAKDILAQAKWRDVFKGLSQVELSTDGTGVKVALYITKRDGLPMHVAHDGELAQGTIAIRRVNDTDHYCYSTTRLATKVGLTPPKTLAMIRHLKLQADPDCFKEIRIGKSLFKMYSPITIDRIRDALPDTDMAQVWRDCRPGRRKPR